MYQIKIEHSINDGLIDLASIKKQVEFKYPGHKVTNAVLENNIIYVDFELKEDKQPRTYIKS